MRTGTRPFLFPRKRGKGRIKMTNAQVADIVRQVTKGVSGDLSDIVLSYFKSMQSMQERNAKAINRPANRLDRLANRLRMHDRKHDGEAVRVMPWHDLPRPRRIQVEEVYQFLLEHKDDDPRTYTVYCACKQTFSRVKNGYPDMDALKAYCYSIDILDYVGR